MSYQPEERYWTDYLRIALPVVGLLLMLGLFWYWASNVIGDGGNSNKPSPTAQVSVLTANTSTATTAALVDIKTAVTTPTTAPNAGLATEVNSASNGTNTGNTAVNTAAPGNSAGNASTTNPSKFGKGDAVVTNDAVNMRAEHSTTATPVESLDPQTKLNVTGDGVKEGDYIWIPVDDPNTGTSGWVADQFVDLAP